MPIKCFECADLGFVLTQNVKRSCWRRHAVDHNPPNEAALMLDRALDHLAVRKIVPDHFAFEIAKILTHHTSERPFEKGEILTTHLAQTLRSFHNLIQELRQVWLLPVGSRKTKPYGYWIITDAAEFGEWLQREKSAPITQLAWISAVARRNFPLFAEQLELDIWQEMHGSDGVRQLAA